MSGGSSLFRSHLLLSLPSSAPAFISWTLHADTMSTSSSSGSTPQLSVLLPADAAQRDLLMQAGDGTSAVSASCVSLVSDHVTQNLRYGHILCSCLIIVFGFITITIYSRWLWLFQETATASSMMIEKGITPLSTSKLANQGYPKVSIPYFSLR
jgi:hypothetical protein